MVECDCSRRHLRVADNGDGLPPARHLRQLHAMGLQLLSFLAGQIRVRLRIGRGPRCGV